MNRSRGLRPRTEPEIMYYPVTTAQSPYNVTPYNFTYYPPRIYGNRVYGGYPGMYFIPELMPLTQNNAAKIIQRKQRKKTAQRRTQLKRVAHNASKRVSSKAVGLPNNATQLVLNQMTRPGQNPTSLRPTKYRRR